MKSMARALLVALGAAVALIAVSDRALALTSYSWTTPASYGGACPTTITLNGMISGGTPAATVQYVFYYLDPSTNKSVGGPVQSGTLDANGSLQVSSPVSFEAAQAGNSWVKLFARQAGGQAANSASTVFSVACTSSGSNAAPPGAAVPQGTSAPVAGAQQVPSAPQVVTQSPMAGPTQPPPTGNSLRSFLVGLLVRGVVPHGIAAPKLRLTNNPSDCTQHVTDLSLAATLPFACQSALGQGKPVLIWDWALTAACAIARGCGYHVYDVTALMNAPSSGSRGTLIDAPSRDVTLSAPASGRCFAVAAFIGAEESQLSNVVCVP